MVSNKCTFFSKQDCWVISGTAVSLSIWKNCWSRVCRLHHDLFHDVFEVVDSLYSPLSQLYLYHHHCCCCWHSLYIYTSHNFRNRQCWKKFAVHPVSFIHLSSWYNIYSIVYSTWIYFHLFSLYSRMILQLKRKKKLNTKNLKTLLVPVLEHLDLSSDVYITQGILKAMWTNCPNLRVLNLKNCGYIITDNILEMLFRVRTWSRFFISRYFLLLVLDGYTAWLFHLPPLQDELLYILK